MFRVELIIGPMFSGKSTELIRRLCKYRSIKKKVFVIGHQLDDRYVTTESICTHDKKTLNCVKVSNINDVLEMKAFKNSDVVGIDEAQFFDNIRSFILKCERMNKVFIIAGLDGDFKREPFPNISNILPLCDSVDKLTAMCSVKKDGTPAIFSKKISNSTKLIDIGGKNKYIPVCRDVFLS